MATLSHVDVGVDVSKLHLDVCLQQTGKTLRIANSERGIKQLQRILSLHEVGQIACEATGGYERLMCKTLSKQNYKIWCVQPKRIKAFIESEGIKAKTDKIDAKMIALFASQKSSSYQPVQRSDENEKLRSFVLLRTSRTAAAAEIKTQLQQITEPECIDYLKNHLKFLEQQIDEISVQISHLTKENKDFTHAKKIITSIPGLGNGTAEMFMALMPELGKVNNKVAAAIVGVAPYIKQSGCFRGYAKISGGRAQLRSILYMAAITAIRHNAVLKAFYERLINTGKAFKVAIVAVMRKLVVYMNVLMKKGELWNPA